MNDLSPLPLTPSNPVPTEQVSASLASGLVIRPVQPDDATGVARLLCLRGITAEEALAEAPRMIEALPVLLLALAPADTEQMSVNAVLSPVGLAGAFYLPDGMAQTPGWMISGLIVDPDARRNGIGRNLLAEVSRAVAEIAPGALLHSVVEATNHASVAVHLAVGFREEARLEDLAGITFDGGQGVLLGLDTSILG